MGGDGRRKGCEIQRDGEGKIVAAPNAGNAGLTKRRGVATTEVGSGGHVATQAGALVKMPIKSVPFMYRGFWHSHL